MTELREFFLLLALCAFSVDPEEHATRERPPLFTISPETTVIDGPLTPHGTIDYIAYLNERYSDGVTPDNNAAVLLCEALGPEIVDATVRDRFFELLGTPAPPAEGNYIVGLRDYASRIDPDGSRHVYEDILSQAKEVEQRSWSADEFPELAGWISINEAPLSIIERASLRPRCYAPLVSAPVNSLRHVQLPLAQSTMHLARVLGARATLRLGDGDINGAIDDVLCMHRLSRLYAEGPTVIGQLTSIALENYVFRAAAALLSSNAMSELHLTRLSDQYDGLPPRSIISETLNLSERFQSLNATQEFVAGNLNLDFDLAPRTGLSARIRFVERVFRNLRMHPNQPLRIVNDWYDDLTACASTDNWREFKDAWTVIAARRTAFTEANDVRMWYYGVGLWTREIGRACGEYIVLETVPNLGQFMEARYRIEARSRLLRIGLALARYREANGRYPEQLADLKPDFLDDVPLDPFTDTPMIYQLREDGYILYSVCADLVDHGGIEVSAESEGDIVLRVSHSTD